MAGCYYDMTSATKQTKEDEYQGKTKCNVCSHKQCEHRFAKDFCLKKDCDCLQFAKSGGLI